MMSGDEIYGDDVTTGLTSEQEHDLDRYLDVARKYDEAALPQPATEPALTRLQQKRATGDALATQPSAEVERLRAALEQISAVKDTKNVCLRHGGTFGDDPDTCWCSVTLDSGEKAIAVARAALAESDR